MFPAMLFKDAPKKEIEALLTSPNHVAEQKMDGARLLVDLDELDFGGEGFYQRSGKPVNFSAAKWKLPEVAGEIRHNSLEDRGSGWVLDGELIIDSGEFHVWDCFNPSYPDMVYSERRSMLFELFTEDAFGQMSNVKLVWSYLVESEKRALLERVTEQGAEGIVFKSLDGLYLPGERVTHSYRHKLVKTCDVVVISTSASPLSAELGVVEGGELIPVGRTSLIGKGLVQAGDVIELNYLYWTGTSVYQPRMMRKRLDKLPHECTLDQFTEYTREVV